MDRLEFERIERVARMRRARDLGIVLRRALQWLGRFLMHAPAASPGEGRQIDSHPDLSPCAAERFMGLSSFQARLKNSRPPRIAVIRSISRSKCSGTSTKLRRSLLTMSSGLSE
jgi:hypothetical protein